MKETLPETGLAPNGKDKTELPWHSNEFIIGIKGAGEMASGIAWKLHRSGFRKIFMMETDHPLAVRRTVSFCEAVHDGTITVEGIQAVLMGSERSITRAWKNSLVPVMVDPSWTAIEKISPHVIVDAILAKKNLGTRMKEARLVIGCGPGFSAGNDVHRVVETKRGHDLGRVIDNGQAIANTGIPGNICGHTIDRVLRAPAKGVFKTVMNISDTVEAGQTIGHVSGKQVKAVISGILRGLIRSGTHVSKGLKIGDIDPRGKKEHCFTLSDKARAVAGGVLEAILRGPV